MLQSKESEHQSAFGKCSELHATECCTQGYESGALHRTAVENWRDYSLAHCISSEGRREREAEFVRWRIGPRVPRKPHKCTNSVKVRSTIYHQRSNL